MLHVRVDQLTRTFRQGRSSRRAVRHAVTAGIAAALLITSSSAHAQPATQPLRARLSTSGIAPCSFLARARGVPRRSWSPGSTTPRRSGRRCKARWPAPPVSVATIEPTSRGAQRRDGSHSPHTTASVRRRPAADPHALGPRRRSWTLWARRPLRRRFLRPTAHGPVPCIHTAAYPAPYQRHRSFSSTGGGLPSHVQVIGTSFINPPHHVGFGFGLPGTRRKAEGWECIPALAPGHPTALVSPLPVSPSAPPKAVPAGPPAGYPVTVPPRRVRSNRHPGSD